MTERRPPIDTLPALLNASAPRDETITFIGRRDRQVVMQTDVLQAADAKAAALSRRGCGEGTRVGVLAVPGASFVTACATIWRAGGCVVPLPPRERGITNDSWRNRTIDAIQRVGVEFVLGPTDDIPSWSAVQTVDLNGLSGGEAPMRPCSPADDALILFSSGSTADPKAVVLSHAALVAHVEAEPAFGSLGRGVGRIVRWGHVFHASGFYWSVLRPLGLGVSATIMSPDVFLAHPLVWLEEVAAEPATVAGGPSFAYAHLCRAIERSSRVSLDLTGWRSAICAGEAVDPAALLRFAELTAPFGFDPRVYSPRYAMTETGTVSVSPPGAGLVIERTPDGTREVVSCGAPADGVEVRLDLLEAGGQVGEILVRSPFMMTGYASEKVASERSVSADGWIATGDLAFRRSGQLFLTGRLKETIVVRGRNLQATQIEQAATDLAGGARSAALGVAAGGTERLVVIIEDDEDRGRGVDPNHVARGLVALTGVMAEVLLVPSDHLPVTVSGKLRRSVIHDLYVSGELPQRDP